MLRYFSTLIRMFLVLTLLAVTVVAAGVAVGPQLGDLKGAVHGEAAFEVSLAALDTRTLVFDKDGNEIFRFADDGSNRELLKLEDMPEQLITSVLTIEDEDFYTHPGVNLRATFRALVENVGAGGVSQGGSTISQQIVKTLVLQDDEPSIPRKIREAVVSWRMEQELTKDEIFQTYLNSVYFGAGAYGVQAAAEVYFGKNATELDWPETALLAALIASPADYDPFLNPQAAQRQRQIVLDRLVDVGAIDAEQARFYNRIPLPNRRTALVLVPPEDYFVAEVRRLFLNGELEAVVALEEAGLVGPTNADRVDALFRGGLRIYTTYDPVAQANAEAARDNVVPQEWAILPANTDAENAEKFTMAVAAIEPRTGAVRALVGGPDFAEAKFNLATQGDRQPGSSFKTFVLIAALEAGFVPNDSISGIGPCTFDNPGSVDPIYTVTNFDNSGGSVDTLMSQTVRSSNCAFVRLGEVLGIPSVIETANRLGLDLDPILDNNKSLPLGATEVKPLEVASAYATIANGGVRHEPYYVERIEDAAGTVLFEHRSSGSRVISNEVACLATQVLEQNVVRGTGTRAQIADQPAAGKTGTTEEFSDAWFIGFTPQLATSVWMGNPKERIQMLNVGGRNVTGGSYPAEAWGQFMTAYHADLAREDFPICAGTRPGRFIREDGTSSIIDTGPCAAYPGYSPADTNNDGVIDQCIPGPGAGRVESGGPCDPGYQPIDTNGDGVADLCQGSGAGPPPAQRYAGCPAGFPYGKDTNYDGVIDTCFANPVD